MLTTMMALIMVTLGNPSFMTATTTGDYYEVTNVQYSKEENETFSIWIRYYVQGEMKNPYHYHVEITPGNVSYKTLVQEAQKRCDTGILARPQ